MPIRFTCTHCNQPLSVSSRKAGEPGTCPKCEMQLTIPSDPAASKAVAGEQGRGGAPDDSAEQFTGSQVDEWIYAGVPEPDLPSRKPDRLNVSRRLVYFQGLLLGLLAASSFVLGIMVGVRGTPSAPASGGAVVSGSVRFRSSSGYELPDDGAVVILLAADRRLDAGERLAVEGLRPGDPPPNNDHESLAKIRQLAGAYTRADRTGTFELRLPAAGQYYFFCLSHHAERGPDEQLARQQIAQMGRYFASVVELVGAYRYDWRELTVPPAEPIEVTFDLRH